MSRFIAYLTASLGKFRRDETGATAAIVAISAVAFISFMGFTVDLGHAYVVTRQLQAATDAAALAGAQDIYTGGSTAITSAKTFSAVGTGKNRVTNITATMVSGYPKVECLTNLENSGVPCAGPQLANAIVVEEKANVPMYFAKIFGVNYLPITATSTAAAKGGNPKTLNIMIVIDTTPSMNNSDNSCSIAGSTQEDCALAGARTLLLQLNPISDYVGLMTFPGVTNATAPLDYDCNSGTSPTAVSYANATTAAPNSTYQVVGLSNDYITAFGATSLNPSSNLAKAVRGGGTGCPQGLTLPSNNVYSTYFAGAITAAQAALVASATPNSQNVIIVLSDGDSNAKSPNVNAVQVNNQCHQAISAAQAATKAGTWVYTIAYDSNTNALTSCSSDSPVISACDTLRQMASDSSKFYADTFGGSSTCTSAAQPTTELVSIFKEVAESLQDARLLSNNAT